jgi:hypothetical protein
MHAYQTLSCFCLRIILTMDIASAALPPLHIVYNFRWDYILLAIDSQ